MKKLLLSTIAFLAILVLNAQRVSSVSGKKKLTQITVSGGLDMAKKTNFSSYVKMPLKGFNIGASYTKYWDWYGIGMQVDMLQNEKPVYLQTAAYDAIVDKYRLSFSGPATAVITPMDATKLNRTFVGIGPSFKYQSNNDKFIAELNLLGGVSFTSGSKLEYGVNPGIWFMSQADIFSHTGYSKDIITTGKIQGRLNYYFTDKIGVNLGAYYFLYNGAKANYVTTDLNSIRDPTISTLPNINKNWLWGAGGTIPLVKTYAQTNLNSYGAFAGISFKLNKSNTTNNKSTKATKATAGIKVSVKDELTGQPIANTQITILDDAGKSFMGTTDGNGIANFSKLADGNYKVTGILNDIATTQQDVILSKTNRSGEVTLIHNDPRFTVIGKAINVKNNKGEDGVSVSMKNNSKGSIKMSTSQAGTGSFSFQLESNSDYELVGKKASYISNIEKISTKGLTRSQTLYVELELGVEEVEKGKAIKLQKIYYDLDKANIREDASSDLEKLIQFMIDNPSVNVEIASHTDTRGSDDYNLKLSQERAAAVKSFITKKGIESSRIQTKGYGETKVVNKCTTCTEEQHQENRRTEFTVINM